MTQEAKMDIPEDDRQATERVTADEIPALNNPSSGAPDESPIDKGEVPIEAEVDPTSPTEAGLENEMITSAGAPTTADTGKTLQPSILY